MSQKQLIYKEGDYAQHMYVILRGAVEMRRFNKRCENDIVVQTYTDGMHFGEVSFLTGQMESESEK